MKYMTSNLADNAHSLGRWRTAIGHAEPGRIIVRGNDVADLIGSITFPQMMYLVLTGRRATESQARLLDGLMVAVVEHGISPSSTVSRFMSASGVPIQVAIAAGIMTFGDIHGGAGEEMAKLLQEQVAAVKASGGSLRDAAVELVRVRRAARQPIPGFGHPQHPEGDPRVVPLRALAVETGVAGDHLEFAEELQTALSSALGRPMKMNIDGVMASLVSDLGIEWRLVRAVFVVPRGAGLAAHALEELDREGGWRQIPMSAVTYDGPPVDTE